MAPERKRLLPEFPNRIALITSEQGAAIGDFTMNLGQIGLSVHFYPTSVEGKKAVFEILAALRYFNLHADKYDLLVMTRGGGSFESLQAFNNEMLVRVGRRRTAYGESVVAGKRVAEEACACGVVGLLSNASFM
jgi:exodeoxyribonuclease VII large subunit